MRVLSAAALALVTLTAAGAAVQAAEKFTISTGQNSKGSWVSFNGGQSGMWQGKDGRFLSWDTIGGKVHWFDPRRENWRFDPTRPYMPRGIVKNRPEQFPKPVWRPRLVGD